MSTFFELVCALAQNSVNDNVKKRHPHATFICETKEFARDMNNMIGRNRYKLTKREMNE